MPVALADVIRTALAREPADRYAGADVLRSEVQLFLERRGSSRLAAQAERRVAELETADDRVRRYKLFGECRFGFRQALDAWPDNQRAADGLRWATRAMVDYELERGDPSAARSLLADLGEAAPELMRRVREAEEAAAAERERVERLERLSADHDRRIGARTRAFLAIVMGVLWVVGPLIREYLGTAPTYTTSLSVRALYLAVAAAFAVWARDSMTRTRINRQILATLFFGLFGMIVIDAVNLATGLPITVSLVHHMVFIAGILTMAAIAIDRRMWPAALLYTVAFAVAGPFPALLNWAQSAANLALLVNCVWIWGTDVEPR